MMKSDYVEPGPSKPTPPLPVRVSRKSELIAALRQRARSIVIEDQELARPFVHLLRVRELRSWHADMQSDSIGAFYATDIEAQWYMARYLLPGNVQKVILKPRQVSQETDGTDMMRRRGLTGGRRIVRGS